MVLQHNVSLMLNHRIGNKLLQSQLLQLLSLSIADTERLMTPAYKVPLSFAVTTAVRTACDKTTNTRSILLVKQCLHNTQQTVIHNEQ
jgi:hypothetical protein